MTSRDKTDRNAGGPGSVESWLVSAGRDRRPGSPLNVPPCPASNFVLGERRAYSRDDATPGWEALEEIVGGLEGGSAVSFASGMAGIAAISDQLHTGSVVALSDDCYQAVAGIAKAGQSRGRCTVHRVAVADTSGWIEIEPFGRLPNALSFSNSLRKLSLALRRIPSTVYNLTSRV